MKTLLLSFLAAASASAALVERPVEYTVDGVVCGDNAPGILSLSRQVPNPLQCTR